MSARAALLIAAVALTALAARLYHLDRRTITHPEVYAPGIHLPSHVFEPEPRTTVREVVYGSLTGDIHPPGFYLVELGWTSLAGTTLYALRLPSVVFGTAAVLLLFAYGRRDAGSAAALFASALLALHSEHVFWSQHARMWALLSCLAIGSALLLSRLIEQPSASRTSAYVLVTAAGLWTEYYFWPVFAAQVVWAAAHALADRRRLIAVDAQTFVAVLGSPVLIYFHYHRQRGNFLEADLLEPLLGLLPLAKLGHASAVDPFSGNGPLTPTATLLLVLMAVAIAAGAIARPLAPRPDAPPTPGQTPRQTLGPSSAAAPVRSLLAVSLLVSALVLLVFPPVASRLTLTIAASVPWIFSSTWLAARHWLTKGPAAGEPGPVAPLLRSVAGDLTRTVAVVPLLVLTAIHVAKEPVLVNRGLVILAPFTVLLLARGVFAMRSAAVRATAVVVFLALSAAATAVTFARPSSPRDYQGLTEQLRPLIQQDDLVVIKNGWEATPMHYYLPPDRFRLLPPAAVSSPLPRRIWIVMFGPDGLEQAARLAASMLPGYGQRTRVSSRGAHAALFETDY